MANISVGFCAQISGFIRDCNSEEALIGANIFCKQQNIGTISDNRGYFSLTLSTPCSVTISYTGYLAQNITLNTSIDSLLEIKMTTDNKLAELTVTATNTSKFDVTRLNAKELTLLPTIGGKPDIIKALQLKPGVQTSSEGLSLMLVRGGEPGQNQYLLDNVPLIYVNHLGGLFSVFNPDMINTVDFYKGNFPARQGGKLSSIVDITQREGDKSKHQGSFSLGVTDAAFTFEGPLSKKASYIVTARKTLIDAFLMGFSAIDNVATYNQILAYGFHDINSKISYHPNTKNAFSFNFYQGDDYFNLWKKPWVKPLNEPFHIYQQWGNFLVSGRWNYNINAMIYTENIVSFSRYRNKTASKFQFLNADTVVNSSENVQMASVNDFTFRSATKYNVNNKWNIEFGGQVGYAYFEPFYNAQTIDNSNTKIIGQVYHTIESALFIDNKIQFSDHFSFQPSFRLSQYYHNNKNFFIPEPRINFTYSFNQNQKINLNCMHTSQSSHLIFTPSYLLKSEVWLPSSQLLPPELADQIVLSWNANYDSGKYSTEAGIYYKQMKNMVTLKEGYENMLELRGIENKIESNGKGTAYGFEWMIRKNSGKLTGSIAYSWSFANRQFNNTNFGIPYEFDYNRVHNFTVILNRELKNGWNMNLVWIFQSGTPFTPALGKVYTYNPEAKTTDVELIYGSKNSARMTPYHRLDIGFNHTIRTKRGNKAVWTYSIYNAYNNINPYTNYYDDDNKVQTLPDYKKPLSLYKYGFFAFIPSISYKVYFDYTKKPKTKVVKEKKKYNWLYY